MSAWIDFNADGDWADPGEAIFENHRRDRHGTRLSFVAPADAKTGSTFTRFRFSRSKIEGFVGPSADGEVEDHPLRVSTPPATLDFGDAPDPTYPTTLKNNGARHRINPDVFLGVRVDAEADGQPNSGASGDDISPTGGFDDEDGVVFDLPLVGDRTVKSRSLPRPKGDCGLGWILTRTVIGQCRRAHFHWSRVGRGPEQPHFPVPVDVKAGPSFSRFRFTRTTIETYTGEAADGEVEDHPVFRTRSEL